MLNIYYGFILLFFCFELKAGKQIISLPPPCLAYIMLYMGFAALCNKNTHWGRCKKIAFFMIFFSLIEWTFNFFAVGNNILLIALKISGRAVLMYINYKFIIGVADIENRAGIGLNSKKLMKLWYVLTTINIAGVIVSCLFLNLTIPILVAVYAVDVVYMYQMYITKNLYYSNGK